jgi:hypothetical protein
MMCAPTRPGVVPVNPLRLISPNDAVLPRMVGSSPSAGWNSATPPKALNERFAIPSVAERCGFVVDAVNAICGAASAAVAGSRAAFDWPVVRAVGVACTVESRPARRRAPL